MLLSPFFMSPMIIERKKSTIKIKKSICAILVDTAAIPPNPSIPAIKANIKKKNVHESMVPPLILRLLKSVNNISIKN
jgi:hypothetical protein